MTKQTPPHTHTHSLPASRDVVTARRPIGGARGGAISVPPPGRVTGAEPWVRATSREAPGGMWVVQLGLHVRRSGWAAGSWIPRLLDKASVGVGGVSAPGPRGVKARLEAAWQGLGLQRASDPSDLTLL